MTGRFGQNKHEPVANAAAITPDGDSQKTFNGEIGELPIEIPRDRRGNFEPQLIPGSELLSRLRRHDPVAVCAWHDGAKQYRRGGSAGTNTTRGTPPESGRP